MLRQFFTFIFLALSFVGFSQTQPFQISIEPISINNLGGIQAFAWAQHNDKWLIIGGRLDGLHQRQPFAAFTAAGNNTSITVVDPVSLQKWSAPLSSLPTQMQEQLSSTNMQFIQNGNYLYLIGGYGFSATNGDHITYPHLTAVNVSEVMDAVINGSSFTSYFRQITDAKFEVTGGFLNKIYDTYYLTGGQKFIGRYNPMGPSFGPGFIQEYTNESRPFKITDDGSVLHIQHLSPYVDATNLHRRDYNVAPQIMPNGEEGFTAFSGVFNALDLPYLDCVNFDSTGYAVQSNFSQYYNHYHCAHIPIYSDSLQEMHTLFFGGIAQYFDNNGTLVKDDNVPFVKTIARVTRNANGDMNEYKLPIEMPELLGAGSEFIPNENLSHYANGVLKLDELSDTALLGYIYGGISSTAANIFFSNTGNQSSATNQIFKVSLIPGQVVSTGELDSPKNSLNFKTFPNPSSGKFDVQFNLKKSSKVTMTMFTMDGKMMQQIKLGQLSAGQQTYTWNSHPNTPNGSYLLQIKSASKTEIQNIVIH